MDKTYEYYLKICLLKQNNKNKYPMHYNMELAGPKYCLLTTSNYSVSLDNLGEIQYSFYFIQPTFLLYVDMKSLYIHEILPEFQRFNVRSHWNHLLMLFGLILIFQRTKNYAFRCFLILNLK